MNIGVNGVVEVKEVEVLSQREDGAPAAPPGTELYSNVVQLCFVCCFHFHFLVLTP